MFFLLFFLRSFVFLSILSPPLLLLPRGRKRSGGAPDGLELLGLGDRDREQFPGGRVSERERRRPEEEVVVFVAVV